MRALCAKAKQFRNSKSARAIGKGQVRWFSVSSAPMPVKAYGAVVAHREITETKRLEEQERIQRMELARASRVNTMGEMAAAMAHELGQPLSTAMNFLTGLSAATGGRRLRSVGGFRNDIAGAALHGAGRRYHQEYPAVRAAASAEHGTWGRSHHHSRHGEVHGTRKPPARSHHHIGAMRIFLC